MNAKFQTGVTAVFTGIAGFINWLATVPPENQSGILGELVNVTPVDWRPAVGFWTRILMIYLLYLTSVKAHTGSDTTKP